MKRFFFFFLVNAICCSCMVKAFDYKGLVLSADNKQLNDADVITDMEKYYRETVLLIFDNCQDSLSWRQENPLLAEMIATRVYHILYGIDDSIITKEQKLDLLHRMILLHADATDEYKRIVLSTLSITEHPEYCIPIMCNIYELTQAVNLNAFKEEMEKYVPPSYIPYYQKLINFIIKDELKNYQFEETYVTDNGDEITEKVVTEDNDFCCCNILIVNIYGYGTLSRNSIMRRVTKERKLNQCKDQEIDLMDIRSFIR
ncbi:MAG: hypothetical protein IJ916_12295 [Paludibacteraceae bacterium]|nr:hypothetical protein [Paludibacteraceae bacterium]